MCIFRYLLEASADVHAQTQTGDTALTYACENGHTDVADLLLQYGADLVMYFIFNSWKDELYRKPYII
jgi:ankyrin repeat protein